MTRYRIEIETMSAKWFLRKEYYTYPQALKARRMINFTRKYGVCMIRIYVFKDDVKFNLINVVDSSMSKN